MAHFPVEECNRDWKMEHLRFNHGLRIDLVAIHEKRESRRSIIAGMRQDLRPSCEDVLLLLRDRRILPTAFYYVSIGQVEGHYKAAMVPNEFISGCLHHKIVSGRVRDSSVSEITRVLLRAEKPVQCYKTDRESDLALFGAILTDWVTGNAIDAHLSRKSEENYDTS
ncbi:hypothetical protein TcasGA2_TC008621 [Tribolium castaneum]|uniref:Uncharacterized protein n=1 Tax=Tribolium castaneum TaxID=7070 RepID=D6WTJ9_TRICA|nr:hypothetical protein TcasGA2_TC008621 [Tribolium castaneum]